MVRKLLTLCSPIVFALFVTIAHAESVELRMATLEPSGSPSMSVLDKTARELEEKTAGRVSLKYFTGGQQGDERDIVRKIKLGQLDGAQLSTVGLAQIDESLNLLSLPMLFKSAAEADYVADKLWPQLQKRLEKKGFKLLGRGELGWSQILSKTKVETLVDLKNQKMGQLGDDVLMGALFRKLGLNAVPLGQPDIDSALASGRITACYAAPQEALALQWYTKVRFMTALQLGYQISAHVVSQASFNKLSPEDQKRFSDIDKAGQARLRKLVRKANEDARGAMTRKGVTIVQALAPLSAELSTKSVEVQRELAGKLYSQEDLDLVVKYRDEFRAKGGK